MEKLTVDELRKRGWIAFEYIRGSHAYGTNIETSDEDRGGVFICPQEYLLGLRSQYVEQVADKHNDVVFYEFGRWIELLLKANPTALESLFVPKDCIVGDVHPAVQYIIDHREEFLSKECFKTLTGYAVAQIGKARGLNKKIVNPVEVRKGILEFCHVPHNQGTKKVVDWLADRGLKQKYCGLVALPNMHDMYGLYYDWGTHIICEYGADLKEYTNIDEVIARMKDEKPLNKNCQNFLSTFLKNYDTKVSTDGGVDAWTERVIRSVVPYGFTGIANENADSNAVRVCTVPKGITPLAHMSYNKDGYQTHCDDYKEYQEWKANRNPVRYENNLGHNYDSKNLMHCMRLTRMGKELALGQGFNVRRPDRDFLLSIRNHEMDYDTIMAMANKEKEEMEAAIPTCNLPETLDLDKINNLLIEARKRFYSPKVVEKPHKKTAKRKERHNTYVLNILFKL